MKRITRLFTMTLIGVFFLSAIAVQAQRRQVVEQERRPAPQENNDWSIASNRDNPYDEVGLQHNQLVAEFPRSKELMELVKSGAGNEARIFQTLSEFCCRHHFSVCCNGGIPGPFGGDPLAVARVIRESRTPSEMLDKLNVSRPVRAYALRIHTLLKQLASGRTAERSSYQPFFELERKIAQDRTLKADERKGLLMMAATARYSSLYWRRVADDPQNPWVSGGNESEKTDWGEVGFADAIGGLFGPFWAAFVSVVDVIWQQTA